ncbi:cytochrome P450 2J5-like [Paramacrobiotus metropolitanus]|uniref:cytochrome P450 2J5-like n=1 Tax=Paramacrobiotus metropolitanus TaxID=2943436 RepID=UPI002446161C|nr:cytochrome P450 2J5-like [Paramacrobiotus metropolitanus]
MVLVLIVALCALYLLLRTWLYVLWSRGVGELPKGPWPVPFLGDGLKIDGAAPFRTMEKWVKEYGKVYTLLFGHKLILVIADINVLKKAFRDDKFAGRPRDTWALVWDATKLPLGLAESEGSVWKEHRRFSLHALRDFGFGKESGELYIRQETTKMLKILESSNGQPMDNSLLFATAASNVAAYMMFSDTFNSEDPRFIHYLQDVARNFREMPNAGILEIFPSLKFVPPFSFTISKFQARVKQQVTVLQDLVEEHKKSFDPDHLRDYIDAFLALQQKNSPTFTDGQLIADLTDLFAASIETTATYLRWAILFVIAYPGVQRKIQAEIDDAVGRSKQIVYADRTRLPFTEATLLEVFRFSNFGPFLLPHRALEDAQFEGYEIPKGTTVLGLVWAINRDPDLWGNPSEFQPERFLDDSGQIDQQATGNVLAFSVGKRSCPGEPLAKMDLLIFFASLLQHFTIRNETDEVPSLEPVNGLVLTPPPYQMRVFLRK